MKLIDTKCNFSIDGENIEFGSGLKESERIWTIGELYKLKNKHTLKRM